MKIENTDIRLSPEDLENIRDLVVPVEVLSVANPQALPGYVAPADPNTCVYGGSQPFCESAALVAHSQAGKAFPFYSPKWWGHELTYINDRYTMKVLHFNKEGHTSMHYHLDKHETLMVMSGVLTLETLFNKERHYYTLPRGVAWVVPPGYAHRLIAAHGPVDLVEASTFDSPEDSIRLS